MNGPYLINLEQSHPVCLDEESHAFAKISDDLFVQSNFKTLNNKMNFFVGILLIFGSSNALRFPPVDPVKGTFINHVDI